MIVSKKNLLKWCNFPLNILLITVVCIAFFSCADEEEKAEGPAALFAAAGEAYRTGDFVTCRDMLIKVSVLDPDNPNVWRNLGTVSLDLGLYNQAVAAYGQVIEIDSSRVDVLTEMTGALLGAGRLQEALHTGELAIQLTPDDGLAFNNYGMALMESGYFEKAAVCFNTAIRREPENASVLYNCGRIRLMSGDVEDALLFFQGANTVDPGFLPAQIETARVFGIQGKHVEAEEQILAVLAIYPSDPDAMKILALSYSAQGRYGEAVSVTKSLVENNPNDLMGRLGLAESLYQNGSMLEALENYKIFIENVEDTTGTSEVRLRIRELEAFCE